jgi:hypothetical protein
MLEVGLAHVRHASLRPGVLGRRWPLPLLNVLQLTTPWKAFSPPPPEKGSVEGFCSIYTALGALTACEPAEKKTLPLFW